MLPLLRYPAIWRGLGRGLGRVVSAPYFAYTKAKVKIRSRRPPEVARSADIAALVGRGNIISELERKISRPNENVLFLVGPGGSGKTALAEHLRSWWKHTGFVDDAYVYQLQDDKIRPPSMLRLVDFVNLELSGPFKRSAKDLETAVKEAVQNLRERKVLLVLDGADFPMSIDVAKSLAKSLNLKVISDDEAEEYDHATLALAMFLDALVGGKSKVLLASRQVPQWVSVNIRENNCFVLPPVAGDDAARLSENLLGKQWSIATAAAGHLPKQVHQLVRHLDYNPLAVQTILPLALDSRSKHPDLLNRL